MPSRLIPTVQGHYVCCTKPGRGGLSEDNGDFARFGLGIKGAVDLGRMNFGKGSD